MARERTIVGTLAALAVAAMLVAGPAARAAHKVEVRAGAHGDFGRIVFDWPSPPKNSARIDGKQLIIEFDEPFEADFAQVRRHLYRYVDNIEMADDGRRVVMTLLRPVSLQVRTIEGVLAYDLVDREPAKAAARPAPAVTVPVRAGEHQAYSRLVFDWRRDVGYRVEQDGDTVTVTFDRAAGIDFGGIGDDPPRHLKSLTSRSDDGSTSVALGTTGPVRLRHFRAGTSVVLDLLDAGAAAADVPRPDTKPNDLLVKRDADTRAAAATPPPPAAAAPDANAAAKMAKAESPAAAATAAMADKSEPHPAKPAAVPDVPAEPQVAVQVETAPKLPRSAGVAAPITRASADGQVNLTIAETTNGVDLSFVWQDVVPAAAFMRAGYLWLVFDRPAKLDLRGVAADTGIVYADQMPSDAATIVRLRPRDGLNVDMRRDAATWTVRLSPQAGNVASDLLGVVQEQDDGSSRLFIPVIDTGSRLVLYDPEVGDELVVVPVAVSGAAVPEQRDYVDFRLLASAQGIVIRPNADDIDVRPLRKGVSIDGTQGLTVTSAKMRKQLAGEPDRVKYIASLKKPILPFEVWRGDLTANFNERREQLQQVLARAPRGGRNIARIELAKFYLSYGMAPEAAAFLEMAEADDSGADSDPTFIAMRGVASLLLHHLDAAAKDLENPKLRLYPDVALWRGALYAAQERFEEASHQFALGSGFLPTLDENFQRRLAISWAIAAANGGNEVDFLAAADRLAALKSRPDIDGTLAYLQGRRAEALEQTDEAVSYYDAAIQSHYRPMRAYASMRKTNLELETGRIDPVTALDQLEGLRFAWRGDNFELSLVNRIVDLRIAQKDYATALQLLRDTTAVFPENDVTKGMAKRLNETFEDLFLRGKADELSPVTALALFYEFQELTPLGADGDKMIQRLADRLTDVDLLSEAAELLEHQIAYRLRDAEKARVGARLAVIYLLDGQPNKALETLDKTGSPLASDDTERQRRLLQARALSEIGKTDDALALLQGDTARDADVLRADIFWRSRRWQDAAATTERLLGDSWQGDAPLDDTQQNQVVQLAVAYYMAGGSDQLDRIAKQYGQKMAGGQMADTFQVLTHHVDPSSTEFRQLATEIARVADLESFMAGYRDRLKAGGLSALN